MIGKLDQIITIQRKSRTPNLSGGFVETWADLRSAWASVKTKAGREVIEAGRVNAAATTQFMIYTPSDLSEQDRIIWQGIPYNIRTIMRMGSRVLYTVIDAERGVAS